MDAVLEAGALAGQDPAGAGEIPLVPQRAGRDPHRGERPAPLQPVQPPRVELIGLVHPAEHELRLARMDQLRDLAGGFDLVHDPVPGADGLDRHRRAALAGGQELLQGAPDVVDPALVPACAVLGLHGHLRVALVGIERNVLHGAPPLRGDPARTPSRVDRSIRCSAQEAQRFHSIRFALSGEASRPRTGHLSFRLRNHHSIMLPRLPWH